MEDGPKPHLHGVARRRLIDPAPRVHEELGVSVSRRMSDRALLAHGLRKLSARPRHCGRDRDALPEFE